MFLRHPLTYYASRATIPTTLIGAVSSDQSAIVGSGNWCFIYDGSNSYREAYAARNLQPVGDAWARLLELRQRNCTALATPFLQVIVPNKATLLPDFFPEKLPSDITWPLRQLLQSNVDANLLAPVAELRAPDLREAIFRRNDSHLTIAGNSYLTRMILERLDLALSQPTSLIATHTAQHTGDLGSKFENPISETLHAPAWNDGLFDQSQTHKTHEFLPGQLNGIRQSFYNRTAPLQMRVLVFGNSFFERVPSWGLSPFFAALFSEFLFVWSPNIDYELIKEQKPDIVISQTCERFLCQVAVQ
jgi:hypothetical protein